MTETTGRCSEPARAIRGPLLTYSGDPFSLGVRETMHYESDAMLVIEAGRIARVGPAAKIRRTLAPGTEVEDYGRDSLVMAGFIDCHVHFPQTPIIGAGGEQLIDWLNKHTFVAEQRFADEKHAREVAKVFFAESLRNGVTTSAVHCTVHPQSVDALFTEAARLGLRTIAGKVLMDRNAPKKLLDSARTGYAQSKALIRKWHGRDRLLYAITPRFAATSTPASSRPPARSRRSIPIASCSRISRRTSARSRGFASCFRSAGTISTFTIIMACWAARRSTGTGSGSPSASFAAATTQGPPSRTARRRISSSAAAISICGKTQKRERPLRVGLATDLGAGTSFSMLQTMNEAYKAAQLQRLPVAAPRTRSISPRAGARTRSTSTTRSAALPRAWKPTWSCST